MSLEKCNRSVNLSNSIDAPGTHLINLFITGTKSVLSNFPELNFSGTESPVVAECKVILCTQQKMRGKLFLNYLL